MNDILNFVALTDRISTSGQPGPEAFTRIAAAGHEVVINLAMPDSDGAIADEGRLVTEAGMIYVHIPVPFDAPDERQLDAFMGVMQAFADRRVWVHCAMNLRVSAFCYHWLRRAEGHSDRDARSPVLARWWPRMDPVWREFLGFDSEGRARS